MDIKPIRVMTVDDHPLMMEGISSVINACADMEMVAEVTNGQHALHAFLRYQPDVILMDIRMPQMNGLDAIKLIRAEIPKARIIVLTNSCGDIHAARAFEAGASAYLLKTMLRTELLDTIRTVHAGKRRIPPEIAQMLAEHAGEDRLTSRELEILRGVAEGNSNKSIGASLHISEHTVKNHLKNILSKLNANDRTHAVMIGMQRGFLDA